mgnify:CR=1 FL=1
MMLVFSLSRSTKPEPLDIDNQASIHNWTWRGILAVMVAFVAASKDIEVPNDELLTGVAYVKPLLPSTMGAGDLSCADAVFDDFI